MTVAAKPATISYIEDGVSVSFAVPFRFKAASDLVVERLIGGESIALQLGTDFSVTGGATDAGGTLTRLSATNGAILRITRDTARAQPMTYATGDRFPAVSHEEALDRQMLVAQEQDATIAETRGRAVMVPVGATIDDIVPTANTVFAFDADRQLIAKPIGSFPAGPTGASNNTYETIAEIAASPTTRKSATLAPLAGSGLTGATYTWKTGDYSGRNDVIASTWFDPVIGGVVPISAGAWVLPDARAITFVQAGVGAVPRDTQTKSRETAVSVLDYYEPTDPDTTLAFLRARDFCQANGRALRIPTTANPYRNSETVTFSGSFDVLGESSEKTIVTMVSSVLKPVFRLSPPDNTIVLGMRMSGLQIRCNGGSAVCDGVDILTATTNSTIRQCHFDNLWIRDARRGLAMAGVVYRNFFTNITVQGTSDIGIYSDAGFVDVTYNTFDQIEVTNVADYAWAYYIRSSFSKFNAMTSDGVAYISSPGGEIGTYTTETVQASNFPAAAGNAVLTLNQVQKVDTYNIRGVDPAKRSVALRVTGTSVINAMRMVGPHPINALLLDPGSSGVVNTLQVDSIINSIESTHSDEILNNWTFNNCFQVTSRAMCYAQGAWTPTFTGWTAAPTVNAATYERIGNRVSVTLLAQGGVAGAGASIGGLPFASASMSGGVAMFSTSDPTKRIANGGLGASSSTVGGFGTVSMTDAFWNMSLEYRA
ncbi:hypothetical protein [Sphingomonas sanguinis]|uniref:hypothetical protein n=1 Tax=Sphingomonas sanguinis TaxID=33051 RepID=UPI00301857C9